MSKKLQGKITRQTKDEIQQLRKDRNLSKRDTYWLIIKTARDNAKTKKLKEVAGKKAISVKISNKRYETLKEYMKANNLGKDDVLMDALSRGLPALTN